MKDRNFDRENLANILQACSDEWSDCTAIGKRCRMSAHAVALLIPRLIKNRNVDFKFRRYPSGQPLKPFYRLKEQAQAQQGEQA